MPINRSLVLLPLLAAGACAVPSPEQRRLLDSMIGRSETDLVRAFGVPSNSFTSQNHLFLAYVDNESSFYPGTGFGWGGFGGYGLGGFGYGGFGYGGYGGFGGYGFGGGFPPSYSQSSCATTFEVNAGRVASWNVRGDGC